MSEEHDSYRDSIGDAPPIERESMVALALMLGAPAAFLSAQFIRYSLVGPACEIGAARILFELATLVALAGAAGVGWYGWTHAGRRMGGVSTDTEAQPRFIGMTGLLLGALFLLAGIALWLPSLFLSPCGRP